MVKTSQTFLFLIIAFALALTLFVGYTSAQDLSASSTEVLTFSYDYAPIADGVDVNVLLQKKLDYIIDQLNACTKN